MGCEMGCKMGCKTAACCAWAPESSNDLNAAPFAALLVQLGAPSACSHSHAAILLHAADTPHPGRRLPSLSAMQPRGGLMLSVQQGWLLSSMPGRSSISWLHCGRPAAPASRWALALEAQLLWPGATAKHHPASRFSARAGFTGSACAFMVHGSPDLHLPAGTGCTCSTFQAAADPQCWGCPPRRSAGARPSWLHASAVRQLCCNCTRLAFCSCNAAAGRAVHEHCNNNCRARQRLAFQSKPLRGAC